MTAQINKYKHYLFIVGALVLANFFLIPLSEWQQELRHSVELIEKQQGKVDNLVGAKDDLISSLTESEKKIKNLERFMFLSSSDNKFKLSAQSKLENILNAAGCTIERIGFKGNSAVTKSTLRWSMDVRYKGDFGCMVQATRKLESLTPYIDIVGYNLNHRGFTKALEGVFNAQLQIDVWQKEVNK